MKFLFLTVFVLLIIRPAQAVILTDVEVLEIKSTEAGEEVKLTDHKETPGGYFFVLLDKKDSALLAKSALIKKKQLLKNKFKLTLEIDSFSATPSGSSYKSSYVEFKGK